MQDFYKECKECHCLKLCSLDRKISDFSPHSGTKDKFQNRCKECRNRKYYDPEKRRQSYETNREAEIKRVLNNYIPRTGKRGRKKKGESETNGS